MIFSIFGVILKIVDFYLLKLEESINPLSIMIQILICRWPVRLPYFSKTYLSNKCKVYMMTTSDEKPTASPSNIKCEVCGIIFTTEQDKEQHKKLEHEEHQRPTGVT
jgi:hypothetical protein